MSSVFLFLNYCFSFYDWDQLPRVGGCPPSQFSGGLPPCLFNPLAYPQTVSQLDLSFCILFQNYKNIPQFETSFKTFYFPFENPAASPSLDRNEPPQEKHPTLMITLDCGYESSQGVLGAVLPRKEPIWLPLRDSVKTSSPQTLPFVGSRKTWGKPRRHGCRGIVGEE